MVALWSSRLAAAPTPAAPRSTQSDSQTGWLGVLAEAQAGSESAFAQLIRKHERRVYSLALRALRAPAEAEELAQDVFLQLYLMLGRIESPDHLTYWLRRIVTHRAIDRLRQRGRAPQLEELGEATVEGTPTPDAVDPLLARHLERHVAALPAVARLVVILRYQEDLDPADIARVLDLSVNTVKSHLKRSLAKLRAALNDGDTP